MKQRLRQLLLAVTFGAFLTLTIATAASFWRGYGVIVTRIEPTSTQNSKTESSFYYGRGGLFFHNESNNSPGDFSWFKPKSPDFRFFANSPRYPDNHWLRFGREYFSNSGPLGTRRETVVIVPMWIVPVVLLIPLALWLRRRRRRAIGGHCAVCGYDMRATPDRCPECGTPAASVVASAG